MILVTYAEDGSLLASISPVSAELKNRYTNAGIPHICCKALPLPMHLLFVERGKLKEKTPLAYSATKTQVSADGIDEAVISGVPAGAAVRFFDGVEVREHVADGEDIVFVATQPGSYQFVISAPKHLQADIRITAA